jgi:hypothetical protein
MWAKRVTGSDFPPSEKFHKHQQLCAASGNFVTKKFKFDDWEFCQCNCIKNYLKKFRMFLNLF